MADDKFLTADIRGLYESMMAFEQGSIYTQLLAPWVGANPDVRDWLTVLASRSGDPIPLATVQELWELYALSRVNQLLLLHFQSGRADGSDYPGPAIPLDEYATFAGSLELTVSEQRAFSPFFHEIVSVEPHPDADAPVTVTEVVWPCLMLGDMLFSRAGVRVTGGRRQVVKEVAENSKLYWAHWRKNRPYQDLSHGWGSNSQWRTRFRRDYQIGSAFFFNVDAEPTDDDDDGLTPAERVELLTHRCFVTCEKPQDDLYPYDLTHTELVG